jgi:hypothetical protein
MLTPRIAFIALALALVFALPASAQAMTDEERLVAYQPIAEASWTLGDCAGHVRIELHSNQLDNPWFSAEAWKDQCLIRFSDSYIGQHAGTDVQFCRELVHEYGHIAGYGHTEDPTNIMYPAPAGVPFGPCEGAVPVRLPASPSVAEELAAEAQAEATAKAAHASAAGTRMRKIKRCRKGRRRMWGRCR